ncbi:MAG: helix-turn-helix transcriptional regulator [Clostridia bacterium]|nr:helix-turn-helix transcriptional regulator [Clostridia bacterium]
MPFKQVKISEMIEEKINNGDINKEHYEIAKKELEFVMMIATMRKQKNATQKQLSAMTGLSQQTISRFENREYSPNLRNLIKITEALDLSIIVKEV